MAQVKGFHDQAGNTLTVWFGDPQEEYISEETGEERRRRAAARGQNGM